MTNVLLEAGLLADDPPARRLILRSCPWSFLLLLPLLAGCAREPLELECPDVEPGALVITELRGKQTGTDTWGQWIELYNTTEHDVALAGVRLSLVRLDGSDAREIVVRARGTQVTPGGYFVLGRFDDAERPDHVDYGYRQDFESDLYDSGLLKVWACEQELDSVVYRDLPVAGSLAFDGALQPSAEANDEESDWCIDDTAYELEPGQVGLPGTPGTANPPCE